MEELFDTRKITETEITEATNYGNRNLHKLSYEALKNELQLVEDDIKTLKNEIDSAFSFPSFVMKQRYKDAINYRKDVKKRLADTKEKPNTGKTEDTIQKMQALKKDLIRQYEKGMITREYLDKYQTKIDNGITSYKAQMEREKVAEEERRKQEEAKKHKFKIFKPKLSDYKK